MLLKEVNWKRINGYSTVERFDWRFNPPTAAWLERSKGLTKQLLCRTLGNTWHCCCMKNFTQLCTIAKPLKYISEDTNDLIHLTLAMFMGNVKEFGTPDLDYIELNPNIMK